MSAVVVECRLFGTQLRTHIPPHCLHAGAGPASLVIAPAPPENWDRRLLGPPAFSVAMRHPDGEGQYEVWRHHDALVLSVAPIATFSCLPGRLEYHTAPDVSLEAVQWQTFGLVLSAWAEWAGRPVLHAATVELGGVAVGFMGRSGAGKSSLTLEFLRHGHRILGDDQLILEPTAAGVSALPAIPWLKLGPDVAVRSGHEHLPRIHSGSDKRRLDLAADEWAEGPVPVGPVFMLERGWPEPGVMIEPVPPGESVLALIRNTYVPRTVVAAGMAARRLPILSRTVEQGGVWRLRYPDGVEWLPKIREAVVQHVAARASGSPAPSPR